VQLSISRSATSTKSYYCGYTCKSQPVGKYELALAAQQMEMMKEGRGYMVSDENIYNLYKKQAEVQGALDAYRTSKGYLFSALLVTDVVLQTSLLLVAGPARFISTIPYPEISPGIFQLEGVVSRKKQLLPFLTSHLGRVAASL
jgi:manganese-dependent inorganic pyrophosphatase